MTKEILNKGLTSLVLSFSIAVSIGCNLAAKSSARNENSSGNAAKPEATATKTPARADTKLFGTNLIINGGAEAGTAASWTNPDDNLKTFRYDGGWGDEWKVTPPNHGDSYFHARVLKDAPVAVFTQKSDVSPIAQDIDAGKVSYNLGGWFGVRGGAGGRLKVTFYDAHDTEIKSSEDDATEKITEANHPDDTTMIEKTRSGTLPAGTRSIKATLEFSLFRNVTENDGEVVMADNLSLVLTNKGDK